MPKLKPLKKYDTFKETRTNLSIIWRVIQGVSVTDISELASREKQWDEVSVCVCVFVFLSVCICVCREKQWDSVSVCARACAVLWRYTHYALPGSAGQAAC